MKMILLSAGVSLVFIFMANAFQLRDLKDRFRRDLVDCLILYFNHHENTLPHLDLVQAVILGIIPVHEHHHRDQIVCYIECAYMKAGFIDDFGKFNVERGHDMAQLLYQDDKEPCLLSHQIVHNCSHVNDVELPVDDPKCRRADWLYHCLTRLLAQCMVETPTTTPGPPGAPKDKLPYDYDETRRRIHGKKKPSERLTFVV